MDSAAGLAPKDTSAAGAGPFTQIPIEILVAVGRARLSLGELLRLGRDAVLALDRRIDDPVELFVGDKLIARGELIELSGEQTGQLAVRLTEVADVRNSL